MVKIDVYKQYFTVTSYNFSSLVMKMKDFNNDLITYKLDIKNEKFRKGPPQVTKVEDKKFYILENIIDHETDLTKSYLRYCITLLDKFLDYIETLGMDRETVEIEEHEVMKGRSISINTNPKFTPRDHQKEYIARTASFNTHNILVDLFTGYGKTFIVMSAIAKIRKAFTLFVLPRYIEKWIGDITELTDIVREDILVIQGMKELATILNSDDDTIFNYKCFVISLTTYNYYIKYYLTNRLPEFTYVTPDKLLDKLGTEITFNDESHQEFHNVFKMNLFSNARLFIGLTATLVSKDADMSRMYNIMFPSSNVASNIVEYKPYINIMPVRYRFKSTKSIKYKNNYGYNQAVFEKSLFKTRHALDNYLKMVNVISDGGYIKSRVDGDKLLIFMGTVEMCLIAKKYFKNKYPYLRVGKYTEEDDYSVIEKTDIIISTIPSSGTALDIPNLITVIQTVNVDSIGVNLQTLGRLRDLGDKKVQFFYTWCNDIPSHRRYNMNRLSLFKKRAKFIRLVEYKQLI